MQKLSQKQMDNIKKIIEKSGMFDEKYYRSQFDTVPSGDLLEYYIINGIDEDKDPCAFFDNDYYINTNRDVYEAGLNPLYHYLVFGKKEGRLIKEDEDMDLYKKWCIARMSDVSWRRRFFYVKDLMTVLASGMFDGAWYLEQNEDVKQELTQKSAWDWRFSKNPAKRALGRMLTTPAVHYLQKGMYEGRNPSKEFSTSFYMNTNPDLINGRYLTPFVHYIKHGKAEGRQGRRLDKNQLNYLDIFLDKCENRTEQKHLLLSVIGSEEYDIAYPDKEFIKLSDGIKKAVSKANGDVIWVRDKAREDDDDFAAKAMEMFEDEAVFAVVRLKDPDGENIGFMSAAALALDEETLKGRYFGFSDIMLRNPRDFMLFESYEEIKSAEDMNLFMYNCIGGSEVGFVNTEEKLEYSENIDYFKRLAKIAINKYAMDMGQQKAIYRQIRDTLHNEYGISYVDFNKTIDINEIYVEKKLNIMIGIYSFTFGGGEIMPIRLANKLFSLGYTVTVLSMLENPLDEKVRKMLLPDIPVVYCNDKAKLQFYVYEFNIQVFNSHHQALQQLYSETADIFSDLKYHVLNVGTSHGMYENMEEHAQTYLLEDTNLVNNTDIWTYVADKNIIPFMEHDVYAQYKFVKVPNGMEMPEISPIDLSEYGIGKDSFVVCLISRALKEKGWLNAINAVTKIKEKTNADIHLLLIGEGEIYDEYAQKAGNDFIHFLGFRDDPCDYFAASSLCVLPSYYASESAPLCLIEAMMCGKPCVASNIGDVKYILECEGEFAGSIFDLEDGTVNDDVLADCIERLYSDKALYARAAETAKKKREYYLIDNIANMYIEQYNKYYIKSNTSPTFTQAQLCVMKYSTEFLIDMEQGRPVPKVSVIVPNYNHSAFLRKRLDCIYAQNYPNMEVILMDDCSKDNSREILQEYADKYPDITKTLFNEKNSGGVFYQWAKGVKNATGELCWIAESDDYCEDNLLEELVPFFKDEDIKLAYAKYCFVDENDNKNEGGFFNYVGSIDDKKWRSSYINDADNEVDTALGIINSVPNASGAVFRNPKGNDVFDDEDWYKMKICGDWIFYLHILKGGKIAYSTDTTSYFRFHSSNSSAKTYTNSNYYTEHEKVASLVRNLYHVDRSVIERNHEKIRKFYHEHINGTDEEFESYYSIERAMKWLPDLKKVEAKISQQKNKYNKTYESVLVDPIKSATDSDDVSFEKKMEYVGANTGNMLFVSAVKEQVEYIEEIWFNGRDLGALDSKQPVAAVIPSSNFIIAGSDNMVDRMRQMYEQTDCPITMAGLGAQAYAPYNTPRKLVEILSDNKIKFFQMAAERAVSLGVRGEFTAECLEIMGIKNYRIIGCPTCFKYFDGIYKPLAKPTADKMIFTVTGKNSGESGILDFGMKNNGTLLMQMVTEMPQILFGEDITDEQFEKSFPDLGIEKQAYIDYVKEHGKIFFDMDKWNKFMQDEKFTFSFGSRFHGNMSALRNGIPSLWITHDSRTSELINTLKLPHISISEFQSIESMDQLLEKCDYTEFYKAYGQLCREYAAFLDENGLKNKFKFEKKA
ncbi:MAG: glycosyltransferase [Firmicutes bacterium]|nr:glycosyltransferase [Bacillota bacterium]